MISGVVGLAIVAVMLYILDPFVILAYNALDASQTISNVGAIKLILGLTGFILVTLYVLTWMQRMQNPDLGGFP